MIQLKTITFSVLLLYLSSCLSEKERQTYSLTNNKSKKLQLYEYHNSDNVKIQKSNIEQLEFYYQFLF